MGGTGRASGAGNLVGIAVRSLVLTFVILVVAGAYLAVSLALPPEGAGGDPHVNVKVDPPTGSAAAAQKALTKAEGQLEAEPTPVLPNDVTMMPKASGAAQGGGQSELFGGGVTVTEQLMNQ